MRKLFAVMIVFCLAYFFCGWLAVQLDWLPRDDYLLYAGMVGALASVIGLVSFIRPPMSRVDLRSLEIDSLQSMVTLIKDMGRLEREKTKAEGEIEDLDVRRKEMEILVRKASLSLFLKEQLSYHERQILEIMRGDLHLSRHLEDVKDIKQKLTTINEEIDSDPNVSLLQDIIITASKHEPTHDDVIANLPGSVQMVYLVVRFLSGVLFGPYKIRKK